MNNKEGFMFFPNMREVIRSVPKEKQLELREAIENYVFDGIESDDWAIRAIIQSMKPVLDYRSVGAPKGNNNNPHGRKGKTKEPIEEIDLTNNQLNQSEPIKPIDNQLNQLKTIKSNKQEKEKEREREKEQEKEQEVKKIIKKSFGELRKVLLSDYEFEKLKTKYGSKLNTAIDRLDSYIASTGKKYKDHYAVLKEGGWVWNEIMKNSSSSIKPTGATHQEIRDFLADVRNVA